MTVCRYKLKDEQYNYLLQRIAGLSWLMESIARNRNVTTVNMKTITDEKIVIILRGRVIFAINLLATLSKHPMLSSTIPIERRQPHNHTEATAVYSM